MDKHLHELYYNTSLTTAFAPAHLLLAKAQESFPSMSLKYVKDWLAGQLAYTLYKPARKNFPRNQILVSRSNELAQADLLDMTNLSRFNQGNKFVLTFIDAFSRFALAEPLRDKSGPVVAVALDKILQRYPVAKLQTDQGKEFLNVHVKKVLKNHLVFHYTSLNKNIKCSMVERWNRTIKSKLFKHLTGNLTKSYVNVLQDFVSHYNNSVHRVIGQKPAHVKPKDTRKIFKKVYGVKSMRAFLKKTPSRVSLAPGDQVRMQYDKGAFDRGFDASWSDKVYTVENVNQNPVPMITVKDELGRKVRKRLYEYELQKVTNPAFRIKTVVRYRTVDGKRQALVRWVNHGPEFDKWIDASQLKVK